MFVAAVVEWVARCMRSEDGGREPREVAARPLRKLFVLDIKEVTPNYLYWFYHSLHNNQFRSRSSINSYKCIHNMKPTQAQLLQRICRYRSIKQNFTNFKKIIIINNNPEM